MSTGKSPGDGADLEAFLARQSSISTDYGNLERVDPPAALDETVLAAAKAAVRPPVARAAPAAAPATSKPVPPTEAATPADGSVNRRKRVRAPVDVDVDEEAEPARRPRWLIPAALAATVLVAAAIGVSMLGEAPSGPDDWSATGALFAKRARDRNEADTKAAAEAAALASAGQEAEVMELDVEPLPPPPMFEPEGPQVQDLDAAIALIRKELVRANQIAAAAEGASGNSAAGKPADISAAAPTASTTSSVIQPRDRRLTKILELFDGGNEDLAADSLEIFLRDFEDDPISQRILAVKP